MRNMRAEVEERLEDARRRAAEDQAHGSGGAGRVNWGDVVKAFLAVRVATAAERVLSRPARAATPESGRLGGEVSSATMSRPQAGRVETRPRQADRAAEPSEAAAVPHGAVPIARRTFQEFGSDNGTLMAASVAFYLLLSLVPLALVGIAILGWVLGDAQAQAQVFSFLKGYFPAQFTMLKGLVLQVKESRGTIGLVGLGTLLLTATGGFTTLETAINVAWNAPHRNFVMSKLFALGMMLVIGTLLVLSLGVTAIVGWAGHIAALSWLAHSAVAHVLAFVVSIAVTTVMFTFIYKFFPNVKSAWKPALLSGFLTAVLWELFKQGYTWYSTSKWGDQSATYGAAAGFVGLVVWIYYSASLVLLGAELTWILNGCPKGEQEKRVNRAK
jgi:membrane protein